MANTPIQVDSAHIDSDDGESTIDEQLSTYTVSLASSVADYPIEHGRRYHRLRSGGEESPHSSNGSSSVAMAYIITAYPLPNDEPEMARLDLMHILMTRSLGDKLYLAPLQKDQVRKILDIGTGTGLWAMEMGEMFKGAQVLGNDLSPIQPDWVPSNVTFEVDDVERDWTHDGTFDFIFCRYMTACIQDWPNLVRTMYENTTPGGWVELQDFDFLYYSDDNSFHHETETYKWITTLIDASNQAGRDPSPGPKLEGWLRGAGFQDIGVKVLKLPIGPWPKESKLKELGKINLKQLVEGLEAFSLRLYCRVLGWSEEEIRSRLEKVKREFASGTIHAQYDYYIVYGQKPE